VAQAAGLKPPLQRPESDKANQCSGALRMQQGVQVKPGDRVVVHGLKARPELNGQSAVLVGPAANGRVNVRLDSGVEIALKQENLGIAAPGGGGMGGGMPGAGGGMPGFGGGMPGFGGGMPGGMPDINAMAAQCVAALKRCSLSPRVVLCVLCLAVALLGRTFLSSGSSSSASATPSHDVAMTRAIREAYDQGYDDGVAGLDRRPPKHIYSSESDGSAGSSRQGSTGFGVSSLLKYGMVGYTVYSFGKTPGGWNPQLAMANAKANPMQAMTMLMMCSGILF